MRAALSLVVIAGRAPFRTRDCKTLIGRTSALAALAFLFASPTAEAHQSPCHRSHVCPSDHATYKWRGQWCVKPTSDKRTARFKTRVVFAGKTYYCHR